MNIKLSLVLVIIIGIFLILRITHSLRVINTSKSMHNLCKGLFPLRESSVRIIIGGFLVLAILNLTSLVCYSFPITTILRFNLRLALSLWLRRIIFILIKRFVGGVILPANSPWYLAPFLSLVELVSIIVRPITLCFRLLANIRAGHVLLTLICKINFGLWILGVLFGVLELMVSFVQAFVFLMLITVYLEESFRH